MTMMPEMMSMASTSAVNGNINNNNNINDTESRSKAACVLCREGKTRCIRDPGTPDTGKCVRCSRFGLKCTYPPGKRRGRPPKGPVDSPDRLPSLDTGPHPSLNLAPMPLLQPSISNITQPPRPPHPSWNINTSPVPTMDFYPSFPTTSTLDTHTRQTTVDMSLPRQSSVDDVSHSVGYLGETERETDCSPESAEGDENPNLDLSNYLDPQAEILRMYQPKLPFFLSQPAPERRATMERKYGAIPANLSSDQDPINLSLLSEAEARTLVAFFHEKLNPMVAVLDVQLHTLAYLRQSSPVLLSAVLAAATKHKNRSLQAPLWSHATSILERAFMRGISHVSIMQSLMILTYYKAPSDTSAWRKIGMAIRMGYQMYHHIPRVTPLPDDAITARLILNAERTWYCLFCFDRGLGQTFGLPYALRLNEIGDTDAWIREHNHMGPSVDAHLAASIDLCKLKEHWRAIFESESPSAAYCESVITTLTMQGEGLILKWFTKGVYNFGFHPESEGVVKWCILDFILTLKRQHYELSPNAPMRLDACLAVASQIVDVIEDLGRTGGLSVMQDTACCMTSSLGLFLQKIFRQATAVQKPLIVSMLTRVLESHKMQIKGDAQTAPAYVARCIQRILGVIGRESRASSPFPGNPFEDNQNNDDFYAQFDEFIRASENIQQTENGDTQFWNLLFSV